MTSEREKVYKELLGYVGLFATVVWRIDPASANHPANVIEGLVQQFGKSKALVGGSCQQRCRVKSCGFS